MLWPVVWRTGQDIHGIRGLGEAAKLGGSLIAMAIVGGAVLTPAMGLLSVRFGCMAIAYIVPAFAYIFIAFYIFSRICAYSALNHPGAIHRERDSESASRGTATPLASKWVR